MENVQEKTLNYKPWVTSGKAVGLVFNENFEIVVIDDKNKFTKELESKIPGGKRKRNNEIDVLKESSETCIDRELREELFIKILNKNFAGTIIIEDERRKGFLHTKDVYIVENGQWKEVGKVHENQVYERKFYSIDKAWEIVHRTHRPLLAIGLVSFFAIHPDIKKEYELVAMFAESEVRKIERENQNFITKIMKK